MNIRVATIEDTLRLLPLFDGSLRNMAQLQPGQYRAAPQSPEFVKAGILDENGDVLVAEEAGELIGLASVFAREVEARPYRLGQSYCELNTLYVARTHRGRGVGGALMRAVQDWSAARGLPSIRLMTLAENETARRFYEGIGMKQLQIHYIFQTK